MTISATEAWAVLLDRSRLELPEHVVSTWLLPLKAHEYDGKRLVLSAPDQWSVEWNESKHTQGLEAMGPVCFGHPVTITFVVAQERLTRSQMDLFSPSRDAVYAPVEGH